MEVNGEKSTLFTIGLDEDHVIEFGRHFQCRHLELNEGTKYLGFNIKLNCYGKVDWQWLVCKVKKNIKLWCNQWFSHGDRLVLVKSILKAIPIYYHTLTHIPKHILEFFWKFYYNFLW